MVDAPDVTRWRRRLFASARASATMSTPRCSKNRLSSAASIACTRFGGTSRRATTRVKRSSVRRSRKGVPWRSVSSRLCAAGRSNAGGNGTNFSPTQPTATSATPPRKHHHTALLANRVVRCDRAGVVLVDDFISAKLIRNQQAHLQTVGRFCETPGWRLTQTPYCAAVFIRVHWRPFAVISSLHHFSGTLVSRVVSVSPKRSG